MRSGTRVGFKLAFTPFMILLSTTHLTVFRNKFSAWYLPMTSALTCTIAAYPFGVTGWVQGFLFGATSGLVVYIRSLFASAIWLAAWYMERSTDGLYRLLKKEYEDNMQENIRVWKQNASQPKTLFGMKWAFHGKEINEIEANETEDDDW
uniref:Uncharacterized protein n=1 Tax=Acrobeloides nanus TaxID=290746 RepID=A0A914EPT6_9BILA